MILFQLLAGRLDSGRVDEILDNQPVHSAEDRIVGKLLRDHRFDFARGLICVPDPDYPRRRQGFAQSFRDLLLKNSGITLNGQSSRSA